MSYPPAVVELLQAAVSGDYARCPHCNGAIDVTVETIAFVAKLYHAGELVKLEPHQIRMIFFYGGVDAGCGIAKGDSDARLTCPDCATPAELAEANSMVGSLAMYRHAMDHGVPEGDPSDN